MATRNGKIAHLPFHIREELNTRLCNGEPGNKLVEWLNSIPAVSDVTKTYFHGRPITEQNMSEWRNGGYEQWAALKVILGETTGLSEGAAQITESGLDTSELLLVITANYAAMIQRWNLTPVEDLERMMSIFKNLTNAVLSIRRSEQRDALVEIQRERLELLREKQGNKSASASSSPSSSSRESATAAECAQSPGSPHPSHAPSSVHPVHPVHPVHAEQTSTVPPSPAPSRAPAALPRPSSSSA